MRIVGIGILREIPCKDCSNAYISETGRSLMERVREHKYTEKRQKEWDSCTHTWTAKHRVDCMVRSQSDDRRAACMEEEDTGDHPYTGTTGHFKSRQFNPIWSQLVRQTSHQSQPYTH